MKTEEQIMQMEGLNVKYYHLFKDIVAYDLAY
jgi:hypothetical protein